MIVDPDDRDPLHVWLIGWAAILALPLLAMVIIAYFLFSGPLP